MVELIMILLASQLITWIVLARFWKDSVDDQINKLVRVGLHLNILFTLFIMLTLTYYFYIIK